MNLKNIHFKKAYASDYDDILNDFYIPALEASVEYERLAGFFSSTSLAIAARGILGLIKNRGIAKLIVSPILSQKDLEVIIASKKTPEKFVEKTMLSELENLENEFVRDHVYALGWMIANKKLEIKIALPCNDKKDPLSYEESQRKGIFHQKVGILKDSYGNIITFSGSINESASGWLENVEEFKVFRSWEPFEVDYVKADILKFETYWNNISQRVIVYDVPEAVKNKLIEIAPTNIDDLVLTKWYKAKKRKICLFDHQQRAVDSWLKNNKNGIFEMATGTGKTFTALGCLERINKEQDRLVVVITAPYQHLVRQWQNEIKKFGISFDQIIADSSNSSWKSVLTEFLLDITLGYKDKLIVLTTHNTFSSLDFTKIIKQNKKELNILLIADEVHGLGATKSIRGLIDEYDFRLGLSATPKRYFDTIGTEKLYDYFGGVVFEFNLKDAINTINPATGKTYLTPYKYMPRFVSLNNEELEDYLGKTQSILSKLYSKDTEDDRALELILFKRANIVKNAFEKYQMLEKILDEIGNDIRWTIIYCTPQQIDTVMKIINQRKIIAHRFTMDEGTTPEKKYDGLTERDFILRQFEDGKYQVLVAMKCLDEGVDVPQARTAIIMASSGNPREYIQRIGRIIRRSPGKNVSTIFDLIVIPRFDMVGKLREFEWKIFVKELERYEEIAKIASNNVEALNIVYEIKNKLLRV